MAKWEPTVFGRAEKPVFMPGAKRLAGLGVRGARGERAGSGEGADLSGARWRGFADCGGRRSRPDTPWTGGGRPGVPWRFVGSIRSRSDLEEVAATAGLLGASWVTRSLRTEWRCPRGSPFPTGINGAKCQSTWRPSLSTGRRAGCGLRASIAVSVENRAARSSKCARPLLDTSYQVKSSDRPRLTSGRSYFRSPGGVLSKVATTRARLRTATRIAQQSWRGR